MVGTSTPHSAASFGIDHPLIAVHDIEALRERLVGIGFNMTAIGQHPWGTSTSLAIFPDCLLEIMGIYDDTLLDEKPAGSFHFGRHVFEYLQIREGVALTALHSTGSLDDARHADACGFDIAGHLEFGREVLLPDGAVDHTKTTLALLPDTTHPRLSFFLCQQHRRDLVEVSQWMQHPNTVCGINGIIIMASLEQQSAIRKKLEALYGRGGNLENGIFIQTPNGTIRVLTQSAIANNIGRLHEDVIRDEEPAIVAMEFGCNDLTTLEHYLTSSNWSFQRGENSLTLDNPELTGNTLFMFSQTSTAV